MFRRKNKPEAIRGDVIGEALVEVRDRIEQQGWMGGGNMPEGEFGRMCLGNHIALVASKRDGSGRPPWMPPWAYQPWIEIRSSPLAINMLLALRFVDTADLTIWNDHLRRGKKTVIKRINEGIETRNRHIIYDAHRAALAEDAEREKLYVPAEWKPRTTSGENREKVHA